MCLLVKKNYSIQIAEEDIPCFKVMFKTGGDGSLYSIYQHTPYKEKEIKFSDLDSPKRDIYGDFGIERGLHTFAYFSEAKRNVTDGVYDIGKDGGHVVCELVLYKATIPKGAAYYEGTYEGRKSYASNALILEEECEYPYWMISDNKFTKEEVACN